MCVCVCECVRGRVKETVLTLVISFFWIRFSDTYQTECLFYVVL